MSTTSEDTPKRMGKSKKVDRLDASRFQAPGINYKGKLIGVEDVPGPRGDKMCHVAMAKLKAAVKTIGEHKLKIIVNISLDGVRIVEEKSENIIYFHPVQRISFISRDPGDSRAFGYVYGREDGSHQFYGVKTEKVAENIVLNLRDLFQIVYEMKKQEKEDLKVASFQDLGCATSTRRSYDSKNGFEQLDVGSSPTATYSPSRKAASKYDGPLTLASYSFASQGPLTDDRMSATLPCRGGFQRGALGHYASETKRSPLVTKPLPWATKQYSSMTAADCRQLYYQQAGFPAVHRLPSTSDVEPEASASPLTKLHSHYSSVQSAGWFPVALPPPVSAGASAASARRTVSHPANGLAPCSANPPATWSSEGWAVFDSVAEPVTLSTVVEDGCETESGKDYFPVADDENRSEFQAEYQSYEKPSGMLHVEAVEVGNSFLATPGVEIKKSLSPETSRTGRSSSSARVPSGLGITGGISTAHSGTDVSGPSPKSPSAVPTLASPESLSDEEEISPDVSSFPSPNTPPPPLPLDTVVDFTLQPPVPPPRPKPKDVVTTRLVSELDESPIYSNLPLTHLSIQNSFTLPRPRLSQSDADRTTIRPRPIQVGYDLTMPRPRPARNLAGPHPHDDLVLIGGRSPAHHPFLRAKTLTSYDDEESAKQIGESTPKNSETFAFTGFSAAPKDVTQINTVSANDPFAICLGSRLSKPLSFVARSTVAMEDGLIHTSISPIPRPRPRQRSVPSQSRDPSSGASKSVSPSSNKPRQNVSPLSVATSSAGGAKRSNPINSDPVRSIQNRTERQASGHRKAESLSCDAVTRGPEKAHKWSLGSSRSDTAPDPFNHVDPFATESFSDDPFSVQPDPLSLESPSSDPFSREFPKKASSFQTRAVTVELGDVFEDSAAAVVVGDRENDGEIAESKTTREPDTSRQTYKEAETKSVSGCEGASENVLRANALVVRLAVEETNTATLRITVEGEQLTGASKSCVDLKPSNQSSTEGAGVLEKTDEVKSFDEKPPANTETLHVIESQTTPSFNERRSMLWKSTEYGSNVPSLEVLLTGQNIAMGNVVQRGPSGDTPVAPGSDSIAGFEDSFDPVPFCVQSDPAEFSQSKVITPLQ